MPRKSRPPLLRNSTSSATAEMPFSIHPWRLPELTPATPNRPLPTAMLISTANQSPQAKNQSTHASSMAIACLSAAQPTEMYQLSAQLPKLPQSPSSRLAKSFGYEIEIISSSWAPSLALPAVAAHRTRTILSSHNNVHLDAKSAMSSLCHSVVLTTVNSISAATNAYGGNNTTSIRCL